MSSGRANTSARMAAGASDRKSTRLNSSHGYISYAVFCLKKKKNPAEVARVARCVCLNHVIYYPAMPPVTGRERAPEPANHARGHRTYEPPRDGHGQPELP